MLMVVATRGGGAPVRNAIHMGLSFCMVFMAFSVSQNFQTSSDHKAAGANALGILYACFTMGNFMSSFVVSSLGSKFCLCIGAVTYCLFVAANIYYIEVVLYISSALIGFGASVLWTAQGAYISNCAALHEQQLGLAPSSTLGYFNGLFFSIFQVNQLLGNLLAAALFKANVSVTIIFAVMTAIATTGLWTLLFLKDPAKALSRQDHAAAAAVAAAGEHQPVAGGPASVLLSPAMYDSDASPSPVAMHVPPEHYLPASPKPRLTALQQISEVFASMRLLKHPRMQVLIPIMIYSGLSQTYIFGTFPPLLEDKATKFFMLAAVGAIDALSSVLMGKLSDQYGRALTLSIGLFTAGAPILFLRWWDVDQSEVYVFFLVGLMLGISDGVFNTQIYAILGTWFEGRAEGAFSCFKLFQAGSSAVAFLIDGLIGFHWKTVITFSWLLGGCVLLAAFDLAARKRGAEGSVLDGAKYARGNAGAEALLRDALATSPEGGYGGAQQQQQQQQYAPLNTQSGYARPQDM